ncbi:MAG: HEAT repeat domain-containing protein [Chloroflexia bacterium]
MPSSAWHSFYESFFGDPYMAWHDGLDTQSLAALEGEEREEAERLLREALDSGDYRPAVGLRVLRSEASIPKLKEKLGDSYGREAVETALALWQIAEWPPAVKVIITELQEGAHWGTRIDAARALRHVNKPEAIKALLGALEDEEDLVRSNAADALIEMLELPVKETHAGSYDLAIDVMAEDEGKRKKAIETLTELVKKNKSKK